MKTIRSFMILAGLSVALFALGSTGARAQTLSSTHFEGTFTLPFETQWGKMALPAGEYSLRYGLEAGGADLVEVTGEAEGSPHGVVLAGPPDDVSATKNVLVLVRQGDRAFVRSLEMPAIGKSTTFVLPHGVEVEAKLVSKHQSKTVNTQLAEVRISIKRVPVKVNGR